MGRLFLFTEPAATGTPYPIRALFTQNLLIRKIIYLFPSHVTLTDFFAITIGAVPKAIFVNAAVMMSCPRINSGIYWLAEIAAFFTSLWHFPSNRINFQGTEGYFSKREKSKQVYKIKKI